MTLKSFQSGLIQESLVTFRYSLLFLSYPVKCKLISVHYVSVLLSLLLYDGFVLKLHHTVGIVTFQPKTGGRAGGVGLVLIKFFFHPTVTF